MQFMTKREKVREINLKTILWSSQVKPPVSTQKETKSNLIKILRLRVGKICKPPKRNETSIRGDLCAKKKGGGKNYHKLNFSKLSRL